MQGPMPGRMVRPPYPPQPQHPHHGGQPPPQPQQQGVAHQQQPIENSQQPKGINIFSKLEIVLFFAIRFSSLESRTFVGASR